MSQRLTQEDIRTPPLQCIQFLAGLPPIANLPPGVSRLLTSSPSLRLSPGDSFHLTSLSPDEALHLLSPFSAHSHHSDFWGKNSCYCNKAYLHHLLSKMIHHFGLQHKLIRYLVVLLLVSEGNLPFIYNYHLSLFYQEIQARVCDEMAPWIRAHFERHPPRIRTSCLQFHWSCIEKPQRQESHSQVEL